jgi:hypothetical protein
MLVTNLHSRFGRISLPAVDLLSCLFGFKCASVANLWTGAVGKGEAREMIF